MLAQIIPMKPRDPREQDVLPEHDETCGVFSVRPGRVDFAGILIEAANPPNPLPPPTCVACGELNHLHYDTSGCIWIGCTGALRRKALGLTDEPQHVDPYVSNPHPTATHAVRLALQTACGWVTEAFNDLPLDQQTEVSRRLANYAVRAYLTDESRGNR